MVKIPTSTRQLQLSDAPVTSIQQGAAFGQGVSAIGQMVQQIAQKEQVRRDNDQFLAARTKYDEFNLAFETESSQLQGDATKGLVKKYQEGEEKAWNEIYSGLSPRAARAFEQYRGGQLGKKSQYHAFAEQKGQLVSAQNTFNNAMAVIGKEASDDPHDVAAIRAKLLQTFDHAVSSGAVQASDREVFMKVKVAGVLETAWRSLYERQPSEALKRREEFGISDSTYTAFAEKHKKKTLRENSYTIATKYMEEGKPFKETVAVIKEKYGDDVETLDAVKSAYVGLYREKETAKGVELKEQQIAMYEALDSATSTMEYQQIVDDLPRELKPEALKYVTFKQSGGSKISDAAKLEELNDKVLKKEITTEADMKPYQAYLNKNHFKEQVNVLRKVQKGERPKLGVSYFTRWLKAEGIGNGTSEKRLKEKNYALSYAADFFSKYEPQTNEEADKLMQEVVSSLKAEGIIPDGGTFWGDKSTTRIESMAAGTIAKFLPDLSDENQSKLAITSKALGVDMKDKKQLLAHNKAWLPVYQRMSEESLQMVILALQEKQYAVTPNSVATLYHRLMKRKK